MGNTSSKRDRLESSSCPFEPANQLAFEMQLKSYLDEGVESPRRRFNFSLFSESVFVSFSEVEEFQRNILLCSIGACPARCPYTCKFEFMINLNLLNTVSRRTWCSEVRFTRCPLLPGVFRNRSDLWFLTGPVLRYSKSS